METPDIPPNKEMSERLDRMWHEHIIACLAIINAQDAMDRDSIDNHDTIC